MGDGIDKGDFLLEFYKKNPDSIFEIGEWETEVVCAACGGALEKNGSYLFSQEFPTENTRRRNLALEDARCPHCLTTGQTLTISNTNSAFQPIPTKEVWFRRLVIDPPTRQVKTLFGYRQEPQEQRSIKEYR